MGYFAPYIDASGLHIPAYTDILAELVDQARSIFGDDIYLGNDAADYQFLAVLALKISDTMQAVQLAYNNRSPATAIGSGLDALVKLNGLARKVPSYSTAQLTIIGTAGITISNGVARDIAGYRWKLPASVLIGLGGSATVTAICETLGAIQATSGTITIIDTPTAGWTSVTNPAAAVPGQPVEEDSGLRARQALSTELPSQTILAGTIAALAALSGVTRYRVYENPTNMADGNGHPAHSITCVVEGGTDADVARTIYDNRGLGCYTNGDVTIAVEDSLNRTETPIRFYRPTYVPVYVGIEIDPFSGYVSTMADDIKAAVAAYLNTLRIGQDVSVSPLYSPVLSVIADLSMPEFAVRSLLIGLSSGSLGTADLAIDFDEVAQGDVAYITITEV